MKRLQKIYIEITNTCNLSCSFCPPHSRVPAFMERSDFQRIINKIKGKADILFFHVKGEPLLHPDLETFIDIAHDADFPVHLTTNGTLISAKAACLGGKSNLSKINISLHGLPQFPKSKQERLTTEILESAKLLVEINRKINPHFLVSLRLWTKDNITVTGESIRLIGKAYNLEDGIIERKLSETNSIILQPGLVIHTAGTFVWPSLSGTDFGECGYCLALRDQAGILVDGTVVPCCLDGNGDLALGNVLNLDWDEIISSGRARAIYKSFSDRKISEPLCRRCGFRTRFKKP